MFRPAAGGDIPDVLVILRQGDVEFDTFGAALASASTVIDVRTSDVPAPRKGDAFVVGGVVYTINAEPLKRDGRRLVWTCPTPEGE